jgi:hypothetical protein
MGRRDSILVTSESPEREVEFVGEVHSLSLFLTSITADPLKRYRECN